MGYVSSGVTAIEDSSLAGSGGSRGHGTWDNYSCVSLHRKGFETRSAIGDWNRDQGEEDIMHSCMEMP